MATRLKKLKIQEVSLVTRPAIAREFLLYKSEEGVAEVPVVEEPVVEPESQPAVDCMKGIMCPECGEMIDEEDAKEGDLCKVCAKKEICPECGKRHDGEKGELCKICAKKEVCPECGKRHEGEKGELCKVCAKKAVCPGCGKRHDGAKGELCKVCGGKVKKEVEEVSKALEAERLEKAAIMKELEEMRKAAAIEKEAKITKEFIEKAATELKYVPTMVPSKFGPILKAASSKLDKNEFDTIYSALVAANAFIAKNAVLTKELGVGGEDLSADPAQQLDAIAKSYVAKDTHLTYARAYEKACMNNPQLYAEHVRQARNR